MLHAALMLLAWIKEAHHKAVAWTLQADHSREGGSAMYTCTARSSSDAAAAAALTPDGKKGVSNLSHAGACSRNHHVYSMNAAGADVCAQDGQNSAMPTLDAGAESRLEP